MIYIISIMRKWSCGSNWIFTTTSLCLLWPLARRVSSHDGSNNAPIRRTVPNVLFEWIELNRINRVLKMRKYTNRILNTYIYIYICIHKFWIYTYTKNNIYIYIYKYKTYFGIFAFGEFIFLEILIFCNYTCRSLTRVGLLHIMLST